MGQCVGKPELKETPGPQSSRAATYKVCGWAREGWGV